MKRVLLICVLLVLIAALVACVWWQVRGVSHRDIYDAIGDNTRLILNKVDESTERLEGRFDKVESKLDAIESKLDKILEIATRPLPDGLKEVP